MVYDTMKRGQTRISGAIGMVLLVTFVFLLVGLLAYSFDNNYVDTGLSDVDPLNPYLDNLSLITADEVNQTIAPIQEAIISVSSEESGWKGFFGAFYVLPLAIIQTLINVTKFILFSETQLTVLATELTIPNVIIAFAIVALIVWFIFKAIESINKYPV